MDFGGGDVAFDAVADLYLNAHNGLACALASLNSATDGGEGGGDAGFGAVFGGVVDDLDGDFEAGGAEVVELLSLNAHNGLACVPF